MEPNHEAPSILFQSRWAAPSIDVKKHQLDDNGFIGESGPSYPANQPTQIFSRSRPRPPLPTGFLNYLRYLTIRFRRDTTPVLSKELFEWYQNQQTRHDPRDVPGQDAPSQLKKLLNPGTVHSEWRCVRLLGEGGFGTATLWEHDNPGTGLPNQLVLKQGRFDKFFQDYNNEAIMALRLWRLGCLNVPQVYEWMSMKTPQGLVGGQNMIVTEYCRHGNLHELQTFYKYTLNMPFPEPFVWHVFHSLAKVLTYCDRGTLGDIPMEEFDQILHYDLKPENIFLTDPDPLDNPHYPTIKVGDWGLSYAFPPGELGKAMRRYKAGFRGGTRGYHPPEHDFDNAMFPTTMQIGPEKDMWTVGKIVSGMMTIGKSRALSQIFTERLRTLRNLAMEHSPNKRISPYLLYLETKAVTEDYREQMDTIKAATPSQGLYEKPRFYAGYVLYESVLQEDITTHDAIKQAFDRISTRVHPLPPEIQTMAREAAVRYHSATDLLIKRKPPRNPIRLKQAGRNVYMYGSKTRPGEKAKTDRISELKILDIKPWGTKATINQQRAIEIATSAIMRPIAHEEGDSQRSEDAIIYSEYVRHMFTAMKVEPNHSMTVLASTQRHAPPSDIHERSSYKAMPAKPGLHPLDSPISVRTSLMPPPLFAIPMPPNQPMGQEENQHEPPHVYPQSPSQPLIDLDYHSNHIVNPRGVTRNPNIEPSKSQQKERQGNVPPDEGLVHKQVQFSNLLARRSASKSDGDIQLNQRQQDELQSPALRKQQQQQQQESPPPLNFQASPPQHSIQSLEQQARDLQVGSEKHFMNELSPANERPFGGGFRMPRRPGAPPRKRSKQADE